MRPCCAELDSYSRAGPAATSIAWISLFLCGVYESQPGIDNATYRLFMRSAALGATAYGTYTLANYAIETLEFDGIVAPRSLVSITNLAEGIP